MIRSLIVSVAVVAFAAEARAASCTESDAPKVENASSWTAYKSWCASCGGTVPADFESAVAQGGCKLPASSGASSAPAAGHQMDGHIANAISAGVSGQISAGDAAGLVTLGVIGNALLAPKPSQNGGQAAAQEAERRRAMEAGKTASSDRLLAEMLPESDNLPRGDQGFMSNGKSRLQPRTQPRAVVKQPVSLAEQMMDEPDPARTAATAVPVPTPARPSGIQPFDKGLEHGSGCYSQNAGPICSGAPQAEWAECLEGYKDGYERGAAAAKELLAEAYRGGLQDRRDGAMLDGALRPDTTGPCGIDLMKAYNAGLQGWPRP